MVLRAEPVTFNVTVEPVRPVTDESVPVPVVVVTVVEIPDVPLLTGAAAAVAVEAACSSAHPANAIAIELARADLNKY